MEDINKCHALFFGSISFDGDLFIKVIEGKKASKPEKLLINGTDLGEAYKVESDIASQVFSITFSGPVAWQVVDESYTSEDCSEEVEAEGLLCILSKSKYLDYVNGSHGFYKDIIGPGKHYRIWTEDQVIEVIAVEEPKIVVQ